MDGDELEYGVYEQFDQAIGRKTGSVRGVALQNGQRPPGGVHACHVAGNAALDHPEGLAKKGQIAASLRGARGVRGGGRRWRGRAAAGRLVLLREAAEERGIGRVRSARLSARSK